MTEEINNSADPAARARDAAARRRRNRDAGPARQAAAAQPANDDQDQVNVRRLARRADRLTNRLDRLQDRLEQGRRVGRAVGRIENRLLRLRDVAQEAADGALSAADRAGLDERFENLQSQLDELSGTLDIPGVSFADIFNRGGAALPSPTGDGNAAPPRPFNAITVTGRAISGNQYVREQQVALGASAVARERGLAGVRISGDGSDTIVRFADSGDGTITATRFARTEDGLAELGSQRVGVENLDTFRVAAGTTATLDFDRLGVAITLDENFAVGDLNNLEIAAPASGDTQSAAASRATPDLSVRDAASARDTLAAIDESLTRLTQLSEALGQQQTDDIVRLLDAFAADDADGLQNQRAAARLDFVSALGAAISQQTANALLGQGGSLSADRVAELLR